MWCGFWGWRIDVYCLFLQDKKATFEGPIVKVLGYLKPIYLLITY